MAPHILPAAYLTAWGTALLLAWVGAQRGIELLHLRLASRFNLKPPARLMPAMRPPPPGMLVALALMMGIAGSLAFMDHSVQAWPPLDGPLPRELPFGAQMVRLAFSEAVMVLTLAMVSDHARWKVGWVVCWAAFSLAVASCG